VRLYHAFRLTRRARCVEQIRRRIGADGFEVRVRVIESRLRDVDDRATGWGECLRAIEKRGICQQRRCCAVLEDEAQPIIGVCRIERHVRKAGARSAKNRGDPLELGLEQQADEPSASVRCSRRCLRRCARPPSRARRK
jgi:hypothetical protein